MAVVVFDNNAGGGDGLWSLNTNWVGDALPGPVDTALISADCVLDIIVTIATYDIDGGTVLTVNEDCGIQGMTTSAIVCTGDLTLGPGSFIKANTGSSVYLLRSGKQTFDGTAAKIIEIQNIGAGNAYFRLATGSVWKFVDIYGIPFDSAGQNAVWEDVDWIAWTVITSASNFVITMKRCFLSGYGNVWAVAPTQALMVWENIAVGYRRDGTPTGDVSRAFVPRKNIRIRNFISAAPVLYGADNLGLGVIIDNFGHVEMASMSGVSVDPGIGYKSLEGWGTVERATAAKKDGDHGARLTPAEDVFVDWPVNISVPIPITSGDDLTVDHCFIRPNASTSLDASKVAVTIDPEKAWFDGANAASPTWDGVNWQDVTPAQASTARGSGAAGVVRVEITLGDYFAGDYIDLADIEITCGGITYTVSTTNWCDGNLAIDPVSGGSAGGAATGPIQQQFVR